MKAPVLPLLLGLSLCGIGSAMLYVYFKTKDEDRESTTSSDVKRIDKKLLKTSVVEEEPEETNEFDIKNDVIPNVIGRNSSNLELIQSECGAKIWFKDKNNGMHICYIKGKKSAVKRAAKMVQETIQRAKNVTEEILVPQSACGKIMGRCGDSLQEICRKSKAKVSVESGDRGDGKIRRVIITGNQTQVNIAKVLIQEKVKEDAEARKLIDEVEAKREPRGGVRTPTGLTPATSRESLPTRSEKLTSSSSVDGQLEVYVSAIASPARFWLQLVGPQSSDLDVLVGNMTDYYNKPDNQHLHKVRAPYLGQIVAAMFKYDSKWYRAEVISILPNEFKAGEVVLDLYFVDYGDSEYVGTHEVCELRTDFLMLRFQAIECYLAQVQPALGDEAEIWDETAIQRFEELTHVAQWKKMLSRTVTYKERTQGDTRIRREGSPVPGIELYDTSDGSDINVGDELVAEGYAIYTPEAQQARAHQQSSFDSPASSQTSSVYENFSNGGGSSTIAPLTDFQTKPTNNYDGKTNTITNNNHLTNNHSTSRLPAAAILNDNEKFSAIFENTANENYENIQKDSSNSFMDAERTLMNGNGNNGSRGSTSNTINRGGLNNQPQKVVYNDWNSMHMIEEEKRRMA